MKKLFISLIAISSTVFCLKSQDLNWNALAPDNNMIVGNVINFVKDVTVDGTPYLFENWLPGYIVMNNDAKLNNVKINLFNQDGELQVSKPYEGHDVHYNVDESMVKYFVVTDSITQKERRFDYLKLNSDGSKGEKGSFFEIFLDGKTGFLKLASKEFIQAEEQKAYDLGAKKSRYILQESYLIRSDYNAQFETVTLKKRSFEKVFGSEYVKNSESFRKKENLKWSFELDVIQILSQGN
jgi:hypothetical protein